MVRGPRSRKLVPLNLLQCSARYLFMYHETSSRSSYSSSGAVILIEIAAQNFMDFAVVGGQPEDNWQSQRQPGKPEKDGPNFGSCNCISIRKLLIKRRRRGKECAIQFAVPTESAMYANEFSFVLRGHMRILLCDGLGRDSSSRGRHDKLGTRGRRKRADIERAYSPSRIETCTIYFHTMPRKHRQEL